MTKKLTVGLALLALGAVAPLVFAERQGTNTAPAHGRYLPEYTKEGDLLLPKNWRSWVYVGSPLTPDALNNGKAGFPEYHNVYIEPGSYEIYKKTDKFPEGTIWKITKARKPFTDYSYDLQLLALCLLLLTFGPGAAALSR